MYVSNPQNDNLNDLPIYGDQTFITGQQIYNINNYILESLNNGLIVDVYTNKM